MRVTTIWCDDGTNYAPENFEGSVVSDLCEHPERIIPATGDAERLVLAVHSGRYVAAELQRQIRLAGLDPLGVQLVDLNLGDPAVVDRRLSGARARAGAFPGSEPEHAKPVFPKTMSRRGFITPTPEYMAAPVVDAATCAVADGCRACVVECPREAYSVRDGSIVYDKEACEPCGRCVTTCPAGAINSPAAGPEGIAAQIQALVAFDPRPTGIAFICSRGSGGLGTPAWFEVEVPCTGMLEVNWLLAPLLLGAASVAALPCSSTGCFLGYDEVLQPRVELAQRLLSMHGFNGSRVRPTTEQDPDQGPIPGSPVLSVDLAKTLRTHGGAIVALALASAAPSDQMGTVEHPASPIGLIDVDADVCTMCSMCAQSCPTNALVMANNNGRLDLLFDPNLCVACAQCLPACPEIERDAIRLRPAIDVAELALARRSINTADVLRCEVCNDPVAPVPMMDRIASLIGSEQGATVDYLRRRCLDCRVV